MNWVTEWNASKIITAALIVVCIAAVVIAVKKIARKINRGYTMAKGILNEVRQATEETSHTPKTLSGAESMYKNRIVKDFPEFNFDIGRQTVSSVLTSYFNVLNTDISDESMRDKCTSSFIDELEARKQMEDIQYNNFKIHKIVISDYRKSADEAAITYQAAIEYQLAGKMVSQYVYTISYVYYLAYGADGENASLICKYCGAPIHTTGRKVCPYCDAEINSSVERTWKVNKVSKLR